MVPPFGELLYIARKQMGFTQAQLAERIGVNHSTICHWERRDYYPRFIRLARLSKALRVRTGYFFEGK